MKGIAELRANVDICTMNRHAIIYNIYILLDLCDFIIWRYTLAGRINDAIQFETINVNYFHIQPYEIVCLIEQTNKNSIGTFYCSSFIQCVCVRVRVFLSIQLNFNIAI